MPANRDESTWHIESGSGVGLVTGAALGIVVDAFFGRSGLGLVFGAAFGIVFGAGLGFALHSEAGAGTSDIPPAQVQS